MIFRHEALDKNSLKNQRIIGLEAIDKFSKIFISYKFKKFS